MTSLLPITMDKILCLNITVCWYVVLVSGVLFALEPVQVRVFATNMLGQGQEEASASRIDHFTVDCSVIWPLNGSEAAGDLVLIQTSMLVFYANRSWREVCIKAWSHPASFALSGQVTKQTTFIIMRLSIGVSLNFFPNFKAPPTLPYLKHYWNDM